MPRHDDADRPINAHIAIGVIVFLACMATVISAVIAIARHLLPQAM